MTLENRYAIRRFLLKTWLLGVFALAQGRHSIALTLSMLFGTASLIDVCLALYGGTRFQRYQLTYWDEAVAFALFSLLAIAIMSQ